MRKLGKMFNNLVVAAALVAGMGVTSANALTITLDDGVSGVKIISDGLLSGALTPSGLTTTDPDGLVLGDGAVNYSVINYGAWTVSVTTGLSDPVSGSKSLPKLHLDSIDASSSSGGNLTIKLSDDGFGPMPSTISGFQTKIGGLTDGTVDLTSYYDITDTEFGTSNTIASLGTFSGGVFGGSINTPGIPSANPFSLTLVAMVSHAGEGNTSFNAEINPVPEPSTIVLLGGGLVGLAALARRKKS